MVFSQDTHIRGTEADVETEIYRHLLDNNLRFVLRYIGEQTNGNGLLLIQKDTQLSTALYLIDFWTNTNLQNSMDINT
jgi:hypothetical protein